MGWQDIVISLGQWVMTAALLPSLLSAHKPAVSSSVLTAVIITLFGVTYFSLHLLSSTISSGVCAFAWFVLAWQRYRMNKKSR